MIIEVPIRRVGVDCGVQMRVRTTGDIGMGDNQLSPRWIEVVGRRGTGGGEDSMRFMSLDALTAPTSEGGANVLDAHEGFRHVRKSTRYSVWIHNSDMVCKGGSAHAILCLKHLK